MPFDPDAYLAGRPQPGQPNQSSRAQGFDPDAYLANQPQPTGSPVTPQAGPNGETTSQWSAAARAFNNAVYLGYLPQFEAGMNPKPDYVTSRDRSIQQLKTEEHDWPNTTALAKGTGYVAQGLMLPVTEAAGALAKGAQIVGLPGLLGAASNPGDVPGKVDPLQADQIGTRLENAKNTATIGGLLHMAPGAVAATANGVGNVGKFTLSTFGGSSLKNINYKIANFDRLKTADSYPDLLSKMEYTVNNLNDQISTRNASVADKKSAVDQIMNDLRSAAQIGAAKFGGLKLDMQNELNSAIGELKSSVEGQKGMMSYDVGQGMDKLKNLIFDSSAKASDIIAKDPRTFNFSDLAPQIRQIGEDMAPEGSTPLTDPGIGAQKKIFALADRIENSPNMSGLDARKIIKNDIDQTLKQHWGNDADERIVQATKTLRKLISGELKDNTGFKDQMAVSEGYAKLYDELKSIGASDPKKLEIILKNIEKRPIEQDKLIQLGDATGSDFRNSSDFATGTPELEKVKGLRGLIGKLKDPRENVQQSMINEEQAPDRVRETDARGLLGQAQSEQAALQAKSKKIGRLNTDNASTENLMNKGMSNKPKASDIRKLQELSKLSGEDLVQATKDLGVNESFKKGVTNGSRRTVFGGGLLGKFGTVLGFVSDTEGPNMTKYVLDAYLNTLNKVKSVPGVKPTGEFMKAIANAPFKDQRTLTTLSKMINDSSFDDNE